MGTDAFIAYLQSEKALLFQLLKGPNLRLLPIRNHGFTGAQKKVVPKPHLSEGRIHPWQKKVPLGKGWIPNTSKHNQKTRVLLKSVFSNTKSPSIIHPYVFQVLKKKVFVSLLFRGELSPGLAGHLKHSLRFMKFRSPPWCQRNCCWDVTYPASFRKNTLVIEDSKDLQATTKPLSWTS